MMVGIGFALGVLAAVFAATALAGAWWLACKAFGRFLQGRAS